ncbi:MAG TPA: hypothetical protein VNO55_27600 [Polyangia bacterium]|nr:hypothetical protein [Polyangia bacterium]
MALAGVAVLTIAGQLLFPTRARRISRALAAQRRVRVQEASGAVRLTGRVRRAGELLRSQLSGRPCVAYEVFVYVPGATGGQSMANWLRLVDLRQACPFVIADESGEARVDTSGPFFLALVHDRVGSTGFSRYPGKHGLLGLLLEERGFRPSNWLGFWKGFSYVEGVLKEGELVSVGGGSAREVDPTGDKPDPRSPPERLVLRGTEALPLLISDERAALREPAKSR